MIPCNGFYVVRFCSEDDFMTLVPWWIFLFFQTGYDVHVMMCLNSSQFYAFFFQILVRLTLPFPGKGSRLVCTP